MQDARSKVRYVKRRLDSLTNALTRYNYERERLTSGGKQLLDWSLDQLRQVRLEFDRRLERTQAMAEKRREDAVQVTCSNFATVVAEFADFVLPALHGARSDRVPVEIESALQRFADRAEQSAPVRLVMFGADTMSYAIHYPQSAPAHRLTNAADSESGSSREARFVSLRIPAIERDSGAIHALALGHEMGHLRVRATDMKSVISAAPPRAWQAPDAPNIATEDHIHRFPDFVQQINCWGEELLTDVVAVQLLGPAALLAFGELVGSIGLWDRDSPTHPGADRRCALMLRVLARNSYSKDPALAEAFEHYAAQCKGAIARPVHMRSDTIARPPDSPEQLAWDSIVGQLDAIVERALASVEPDETFDARQFQIASAGRAVLAAGRPFAEYASTFLNTAEDVQADDLRRGHDEAATLVPVDVPAILNAAWLVRLSAMATLAEKVRADIEIDADYSRVCAVLDGLVLKSIEISEHLQETS